MPALWIILGLLVVVGLATLIAVTRSRSKARLESGRRAPTTPPGRPPQPSPGAGPAPGTQPAPGPRAGPDEHPGPAEAGETGSEVAEGEVLQGEAVILEAAAQPETAEPEPVELRSGLGKTRGRFGSFFRSLRARGSVDDETWQELEEGLIAADVGVATVTEIVEDLRSRVRSGELIGSEAVVQAVKEDLRRVLAAVGDRSLTFLPGETNIWLFVGVNGVGKTTTIGKLARQQAAMGRSVLLAAGDTFRAAAGQQLQMWAERSDVEIVRGGEGGDPSAVVFDAVQRAVARGNDLVLADTAGRLHTKVNLVEELKKIRRVSEKPPGKLTEVLLVLDATTGQNGLTQAKQFLEAVGVTGVVLTKLDGSAKGGIVVAIQRDLGIPVKLVGIGEGVADLIPFDEGEFVDALFDQD